MKIFDLILCLSFFILLAGDAAAQDRKVERKVYYDSFVQSYFRYIKDPSHSDSWTIEKLLNDRKTKNGVSIEYILMGENEKQDTLKFVAFYKKGIRAPLRLTAYSGQHGFLENFGEDTGKEDLDPWRNALYQAYIKSLGDSMRVYYLLIKDTVFTEDYYLGYRQTRTIINKTVFDSVFATTQTPGAKIFYANCTSCHSPFKDATGPALEKITQRRSDAWLRKWIRNPAKMLADNDQEAWSVYEQWNRTAMTCFPLSDKEMDKLIEFLKTL